MMSYYRHHRENSSNELKPIWKITESMIESTPTILNKI